MNDLLALLADNPLKIKKEKIKRKAVVKVANLTSNLTTFTTATATPNLTAHPKPTEYFGYMSSSTFGHFYNRDDPINDYFYKCLASLKSQHLHLLGDLRGIKYVTAFTPQGFKFKPVFQCFDKHNSVILHEQCVNKLCKFKLQVKPYDFVAKSNGMRIAGLTIKVISVTIV